MTVDAQSHAHHDHLAAMPLSAHERGSPVGASALGLSVGARVLRLLGPLAMLWLGVAWSLGWLG